MSTYKTTVGIEVHVELKTKSKMFCGCLNDPHASTPNSNTCPVCLAHPGTLPVVNKEAVAHVLKVGLAIKGECADFSEFDRKNYFYPDIPKAYQISQYANPLVKKGEINGVAITRIHLEEDTARSQHEQNSSLVDFNRAGVPLMELVTEPVIHCAEDAGNFGRELQLLLRTLGVSDANMEKGEMRVEANISVSKSDELGTKVEVKNLNSFKAMEAAIDYETVRHIELLEKGEVVVQETRGWDENKLATFSQRLKETANDYRYFPDPDIPKYSLAEISEFSNSRMNEKLPVLATELRDLYREHGLPLQQIEILVSDFAIRNYFYKLVLAVGSDTALVQLAANYLVSDVTALILSGSIVNLDDDSIPPFIALMQMVVSNDLNSRTAKDLLLEVINDTSDPRGLAKDRGLLQLSSNESLIPVVEEIISSFSKVVEEYKGGKDASLQFLVGQAMKVTRGTANPTILASLFKEKIK